MRTIRIDRGPAVWQRGELTGSRRADPLVVYGFDPDRPADVLYTERALLELDGRANALRLPARRGKIGRP